MAVDEDASQWRNLLIYQLNDDCKFGSGLVFGDPKQKVSVYLGDAAAHT